MKHIDVLVQGEGFTDIQVVTVESEASVDTLFETIGRKRAAGDGEELIFVEDFAVPVDTDMLFAELLPEGIETEAGGGVQAPTTPHPQVPSGRGVSPIQWSDGHTPFRAEHNDPPRAPLGSAARLRALSMRRR